MPLGEQFCCAHGLYTSVTRNNAPVNVMPGEDEVGQQVGTDFFKIKVC